MPSAMTDALKVLYFSEEVQIVLQYMAFETIVFPSGSYFSGITKLNSCNPSHPIGNTNFREIPEEINSSNAISDKLMSDSTSKATNHGTYGMKKAEG